MSGLGKRRAGVPDGAHLVLDTLSKADLLEAAWDLASLANRAGSADDAASTLRAVIDYVNVRRASRGQKPIDLGALARKYAVCGMCKGSGTMAFGSFAAGIKTVTCSGCGGTRKSRHDLAILEAAAAEKDG